VHGMLVASVFPSIIAAHFVRPPAGPGHLSPLSGVPSNST
jgi:hypothetical protein